MLLDFLLFGSLPSVYFFLVEYALVLFKLTLREATANTKQIVSNPSHLLFIVKEKRFK